VALDSPKRVGWCTIGIAPSTKLLCDPLIASRTDGHYKGFISRMVSFVANFKHMDFGFLYAYFMFY
jgi:hypothetical protein